MQEKKEYLLIRVNVWSIQSVFELIIGSTSKNETHYSGFTQIVKVWKDLQNYFEDTFGMKQASKKIC
jgi:hypothetical protein